MESGAICSQHIFQSHETGHEHVLHSHEDPPRLLTRAGGQDSWVELILSYGGFIFSYRI